MHRLHNAPPGFGVIVFDTVYSIYLNYIQTAQMKHKYLGISTIKLSSVHTYFIVVFLLVFTIVTNHNRLIWLLFYIFPLFYQEIYAMFLWSTPWSMLELGWPSSPRNLSSFIRWMCRVNFFWCRNLGFLSASIPFGWS